MSSVNAPALFRDMGAKFKLDDKVVTFMVETLQLTSLEEFAHLVTSEQELAAEVISKVAELGNAPLQTARLRMAWCGVKEAMASSENASGKELKRRIWMSCCQRKTWTS